MKNIIDKQHKMLFAHLDQKQTYIEDVEKTIAEHKSQQEVIKNNQNTIDVAVENFVLNKDITALNRIITSERDLTIIASKTLSDDTHFKEFRKVENSSKIAVIGISKSKEEVIGEIFDPLSLASTTQQTKILKKLRKS